jgi:acetylornithine deacetylase/succinyl-diaminopimelate desuccinylase-like protein
MNFMALNSPANPLAQWVDSNRQRLLDELFDFIRIPSVSTAPEHKSDVIRAAQFVADGLKAVGLDNVEIIPTEGHPLVYAEWLHAPGKPTVLCYGHYDVQPPEPLELWKSPPFEPTLRNGNIYARGAVDDKGQMYMHLKAVEALRAVNGTLPVNLKFLIEGEEEVGGEAIAKYVPLHKDKLAAEVALVSDTELFADGLPTLCVGLRGLVYLEVEAMGPSKDLHSGMYGGAAPNAVYGLIELLSKAKDADGRLLIPGIYDDVAEPAAEELASWNQLPFDEAEYLRHEVGSSCLTGEPGRSVFERTWSRPTFEVHGIVGGWVGTGAKTVIPAKATAKVSLRLVPDMTVARVVDLVKAWAKASAPAGIQCEVRLLSGAPATVVKPDHPAIHVAAEVFSEVLGKETVYIRSGGSIPIVGEFARELGIPTVLMGIGLPDDDIHSPNEKFKLENYYLGIQTVARFLERYGKAK